MKENRINYNSMSEIFELLEHHIVNNTVLRNYGNLLDDKIYIRGHGDVNLICQDSAVFAKVLNAQPHDFQAKKGKSD